MDYHKLLDSIAVELREYHHFRRQGNVPQALACLNQANVLKEMILLTQGYKKLVEHQPL